MGVSLEPLLSPHLVVMAHGEGGKIATKSASSIHQTIHQSYAARSSFARRSLDTPWRLKVEHFGGLNRTEQRFKKKENDFPTAVSYFHPSQESKPACENPNQEKLPECPERGKNHAQQRCTHVVTADGNQTLANQSMREAQAKQTLKGAFGTNNRRDLNLLKYQGTAS